MYTSKDLFIKDYTNEGELTLSCLKELTDESLDQAVTEDDRTLGEIAWHITQTLGGFATLTGEKFEGATFNTERPVTAKEIADTYEQTFRNIIQSYQQSITDENLSDEVNFFGHPLSKADLLYKANAHQIHHRGQMTVLMRQADLHVPSIYGPSRDDK